MSRLETKRLFLALELPDSIRAALTTLQKELQKSGADVKWVEPHNLHITLKFLGDVALDRIPKILSALKKILPEKTTLPLTLNSAGAFPSKNAPRVIWAGFNEQLPRLKPLVEKIETALAALGFPKDDKPFFAHATLGRVRSPQNKITLAEKIIESGSRMQPREFSVDGIRLIESRLTSAGPTYTTIETI